MRRFLGWTIVLFIGLSSVAATWSQSTRAESPRLHAWKLAQDSIQESEIRKGVPKFISWATTREIFPCGDRSPAARRHLPARDFFDESFHYNPEASARLCEPLNPGRGILPLDMGQVEWSRAEPKPSAITPFPDGARLAGAFWNAMRRPTDSRNGKIVPLAIRSGDAVLTRKIRITVPKNVAIEVPSCSPASNQGETGATDVVDVSLDEFFWVRLNPGERYNGASCGDFVVLMAFHLVHKVNGRWLWTTFWWDPDSKEFGRDRPKNFKGAGENPSAWRNYAMDASFESTGTIFNPWRIEERGDNCARCHAEVTVYKSATSDAKITFDSVTAARNRFQ